MRTRSDARRTLGPAAEPAHCGRPCAWAFDVLLALPLAVSLAAPAAAEDVAIRLRDDGRVDVRAKGAPLVSVLDRLANQTGMTVTYQGPPPRRTVSLEVYGANHFQAVMEVLDGLGVDYAVTTDAAGTRVLSLVVAGPTRSADAHQDPVDPSPLPADSTEPDPPALPTLPAPTDPADPGTDPAANANPADGPPQAEDPGAAGSASAGEAFSPLSGDFVPGGRATGQPPEWGQPEFVLPDPPDVTVLPDADSPESAPSPGTEPGR